MAVAKAVAHILAWPLIVLSALSAGLFTYLAIIAGLYGDELRQTITSNVVFVVVANLVGLLLISAVSGFRSKVLKIGAGISLGLVILCFGLAFLGFLQPR